MNRLDQGHATLDVARAAINLGIEGLSTDNPIALWGYSQGGGAAAAALELEATYAPELNIVAGMAGAVPANLYAASDAISGGPLGGISGYVTNGLIESYPEIKPNIVNPLNEKGLELMEKTKDQCAEETVLTVSGVDSRTLTKSGESLSELMHNDPEIRAVIEKQSLGTVAPRVPVMVIQGRHDDVVPVGQTREMARQWAEAGAKVYYKELNVPELVPLVNHAAGMVAGFFPALEWVENGFLTGTYPTSNLSDIPAK